MRFGHCDICDKFAPIRFAILYGIETYYCQAHEAEAPAWAYRVQYWRRIQYPDISPAYQPTRYTG